VLVLVGISCVVIVSAEFSIAIELIAAKLHHANDIVYIDTQSAIYYCIHIIAFLCRFDKHIMHECTIKSLNFFLIYDKLIDTF